MQLQATYADGSVVVGEHSIDEPPASFLEQPIIDLSVTPTASINERAEAAIINADVVVLGPGDLYTSVLANCVVEGMPSVLRHTRAQIVYVSNLMTKRGQTTDMGVAEHIAELERYIGRLPDVVLVNTGTAEKELLAKYAADGERPVVDNYTHTGVIKDDFLARGLVATKQGDTLKRSLVRHDSGRVARAILDTIHGTRRLL